MRNCIAWSNAIVPILLRTRCWYVWQWPFPMGNSVCNGGKARPSLMTHVRPDGNWKSNGWVVNLYWPKILGPFFRIRTALRHAVNEQTRYVVFGNGPHVLGNWPHVFDNGSHACIQFLCLSWLYWPHVFLQVMGYLCSVGNGPQLFGNGPHALVYEPHVLAEEKWWEWEGAGSRAE